MEWKCSIADTMHYLLKNGKEFMFLSVYVEEILRFGMEQYMINMGITKLKIKFEVSISKTFDQFLGISNDDENDMVILHSTLMHGKVLDIFSHGDCRLVSTSILAGHDLSLENVSILEDLIPYRQLVCAVMPLANTLRPGIFFAVNYLARIMH